MPTIVLDTNILRPELNVESAAFEMLRTLADLQGHDLALPEIVYLEATEMFRRELESTWRASDDAVRRLRRFLPDVKGTDVDRDRVVMGRAAQLQELFRLLPAPANAADEAVRREVRRQAPAKSNGTGARDCIIWITVRDLANSGETTYFVTENASDFGKGVLRAELVEELSAPERVIYCDSLAALLEKLGTRDDRATVLRLVEDPEVVNAVAQALAQDTFLLAMFTIGQLQSGAFLQGSGPMETRSVGRVEVESFALGEEHFAVIRCTWQQSRTLSVRYPEVLTDARQTFAVVTETPATVVVEHDGTIVDRASVTGVGPSKIKSLDAI